MDKEAVRNKLKKYQWPIYIVMVVAYLLTPFSRGAPAIMGPELVRDLRLDAAQFGLMGLTFFWTYALANAPIGILMDKIGTRLGLAFNLVLIAVGCSIFSFAGSITPLIIGRMIVAVGAAGMTIAGIKTITAWFTTKQFPELYGLWMGLGALGGVFATAPLQFMMSNLGWRYSFALIAAACIVFAVLSYIIVRSRPADVGLDSPDEIAGEVINKAPTVAEGSSWEAVKQIVKMPVIWLIALYFIGLNASGQVMVSLWGGVYLANAYALSKPVITEILTIAAVCLVVGSVAAGWLNKRIGSSGVMLSAAILFLVTWLYMTINIRNLSIIELKVIFGIIGFVQMYGVVAGFTVVRMSVPAANVGFAVGFANTLTWMAGAGLFQQVWGIIIKNVSKGVTPYPVEAFEVAMWVQAVTLVVSFICAIYLSRYLKKSASSAQVGS